MILASGYPQLEIARFSKQALAEGIEHYKIEGADIRVTDAAHTVADCFRFRSKVGLDVALEGLRKILK